ncbi:DUF4422 domain-containing protein [Lactobacillus delbrueckii]|uniref:DUF4422 domain-containing protein n=1 Tax=Lactobacillus delbrueckii TaxID=1584 RepID=UPI003A875AC6
MVMYVITHKKFNQNYPNGYVSLLVGANNKTGDYTGYLKDDQGDNISDKNKNYCELTGLYWIWKNCNDENVGLSHYRRYFTESSSTKIVEVGTLEQILHEYDWIVAKPEELGNWHFKKRNLYQQYKIAHNIQDLDTVRDIISRKYPSYLDDFDKVMQKVSLSPYNMFYTTKKNADEYCSWLFDILFEAEKIIDISDYDNYQARIFGFLSERLLNVYLEHNKFKVKYLDVLNTEPNPPIKRSLLGEIAYLVRWH